MQLGMSFYSWNMMILHALFEIERLDIQRLCLSECLLNREMVKAIVLEDSHEPKKSIRLYR